jgi:glucose-1-phosphate cytidylyltransferase
MTYGDGVADINIDLLVKFHKGHGKMVTVTAVHPTARFGELEINDGKVVSFKEKPQTAQGWINGGYFVMEPEFFDFIEGDNTILEKEPLEKETFA